MKSPSPSILVVNLQMQLIAISFQMFFRSKTSKDFAPSFIVGDLDIAETENGFYIIELLKSSLRL